MIVYTRLLFIDMQLLNNFNVHFPHIQVLFLGIAWRRYCLTENGKLQATNHYDQQQADLKNT